MDRTPKSIALAEARQLPWKPGRSAEAFVDGELEIRFTPRPTNGPQTPHQRDEVYIVAAGSGFYRVDGERTAVGPGDMCFAAAHAPHGFEDFTDDFAIWIIFYGPTK
ncbi:MAG TPA: cupin domain-containing protein [Reyranella sp.]|nr:cupin domain-containing protein [Reyranella sp.]